MTEDKSTLINTCVMCGSKRNTRYVKRQGHTCIQCISDDDLVFCDQCGEYHKFKDFPVKAIRKNVLMTLDELHADGRVTQEEYMNMKEELG